MRPDHGVHRVPRSRHELGISTGPCGVSPSAVRRKLAFTVSSSRELFASSEVLRQTTRPSCFEQILRPDDQPRSAFLGASSLIAASTSGVHSLPGAPIPPAMFRPRRFSRPRRFTPPPAFAGLFHPAATSRVCPPGVCPSPRSRTGFPRPFHALVTLNAQAFDRLKRPRLQGLAPRGECGVARGCLDPARSAPLLGFSSSGFSPLAPWKRLHAPSARDLHCDEPAAAGLRRIAGARIGSPGIRLPTRSRFPA